MSPDQSEPTKPHGLIVSPSTGLMKLSDGGSAALAEIINRSLLHIHTSKVLALPHHKAGEECEIKLTSGVSIVMCWIPPGDFLMGSSIYEEGSYNDETQHPVKLTQGFWLAKTPITQAQWQAVMTSNPSDFKGKYLPVDCVTWDDICGNELEPSGFLVKLNNLITTRWRFFLPSEAQWEYACRAGETEPFAADVDKMAWYVANSGEKTHPVAQKYPNAWGLHDMHGNVWEWCSDWFEYHNVNAETDPAGPPTGRDRVLRGGSWGCSAGRCRAASRIGSPPDYSYFSNGFRIACTSVAIEGKRVELENDGSKCMAADSLFYESTKAKRSWRLSTIVEKFRNR